MTILMITTEVHPYAKVGGLADAVAALASALVESGNDVRILLPGYSDSAPINGIPISRAPFTVPLGYRSEIIKITAIQAEKGFLLYVIDHPSLFNRAGIYGPPTTADFSDNARRFSLLFKASPVLCESLGWVPDIVQAHDWPAAPIMAYMRKKPFEPLFDDSAAVLTIHNAGYHGLFARHDIHYTGLDWGDFFSDSELRKKGLSIEAISFLKCGILHADALTTVSPTYAREIQFESHAGEMAALIKKRKANLSGILNGIDYKVWNPSIDPYINHTYSSENMVGKSKNKRELQKLCGFPEQPEIPLIGMVSRLAEQKGFVNLCKPDIGCLPGICMDLNIQIVILGTGERWIEERLKKITSQFPNCRAFITFDEKKAHQIEAGSDFFLMPSIYEPCGLNQMYSLSYGTLPIVRNIGGFADTVEDYNRTTGDGTGFIIKGDRPQDIYDQIKRVTGIWKYRYSHIEKMRENAMSLRFSWKKSGELYEQVFRKALLSRRGPSRVSY